MAVISYHNKFPFDACVFVLCRICMYVILRETDVCVYALNATLMVVFE